MMAVLIEYKPALVRQYLSKPNTHRRSIYDKIKYSMTAANSVLVFRLGLSARCERLGAVNTCTPTICIHLGGE